MMINFDRIEYFEYDTTLKEIQCNVVLKIYNVYAQIQK